MEIVPGVGVASAKVGEKKPEVDERLGAHSVPFDPLRLTYKSSPGIIVYFDRYDIADIIELYGPDGDGGEEVEFDGVQLTGRPIDDVVADLKAKGHEGTEHEFGYLYDGFLLFSHVNLWQPNKELRTDDGTSPTVDAVTIAAPDYLTRRFQPA